MARRPSTTATVATAALLAPTASLPSLRNPDSVSEDVVSEAIKGLVALYCPLSSGVALSSATSADSVPTVTSAPETTGKKRSKIAITETGTSTPSSGIMTPMTSTGSSLSTSVFLIVPVLDSGYASGVDEEDEEDEDEGEGKANVLEGEVPIGQQHDLNIANAGATATAADTAHQHQQHASALAALRADHFERAFAERWLTTFLARAEEIYFSTDDDDAAEEDDNCEKSEGDGDGYDRRQELVDKAACVLASFHTALDDEQDDEGVVRDLNFPLWSPNPEIPVAGGCGGGRAANAKEAELRSISVQLNDGAHNSNDHTDVGLQSWGASVVFSELLCADPQRFGLLPQQMPRRILELGAGTGLVSLALGKLLPELDELHGRDGVASGASGALIVATDYHAAVLENLERNIATNFPVSSSPSTTAATKVIAHPLDWSAPDLATAPLDAPFDMLVATDVVYAPEHATWLRQCASRLLSREEGAVFWLVATVRRAGKFEGISDTVRTAFTHPAGEQDESRVGPARPSSSSSGEQQQQLLLRILEEQVLDRPKGVGHGDESGYRLFKIGWA